MKYYGKIVHNKDLITKEYADDRLYMKVDKLDYDPDQKTAAMTHSVGKDGSGKLWAQPSVTPRGSWTSSESYVKGDTVSYLGGSYIAVQNNTNIVPTNTSYWMNLATKGDTGATGATGPQGPTGPTGPQGPPGPPGSVQTAIVTIETTDWSGLTCTKPVSGVTAANSVIVDPSDANVECTGQGAGTLTFTAAVRPVDSVTVKVVILS